MFSTSNQALASRCWAHNSSTEWRAAKKTNCLLKAISRMYKMLKFSKWDSQSGILNKKPEAQQTKSSTRVHKDHIRETSLTTITECLKTTKTVMNHQVKANGKIMRYLHQRPRSTIGNKCGLLLMLSTIKTETASKSIKTLSKSTQKKMTYRILIHPRSWPISSHLSPCRIPTRPAKGHWCRLCLRDLQGSITNSYRMIISRNQSKRISRRTYNKYKIAWTRPNRRRSSKKSSSRGRWSRNSKFRVSNNMRCSRRTVRMSTLSLLVEVRVV